MYDITDDFYMILPSKYSANKYVTKMKNPLTLFGTWEVALTEYSFTYFTSSHNEPTWIRRVSKTGPLQYKFTVERVNNKLYFNEFFGHPGQRDTTVAFKDGKQIIITSTPPYTITTKYNNGQENSNKSTVAEYTINKSSDTKDFRVDITIDNEKTGDIYDVMVFKSIPHFTAASQVVDFFKSHCSHIFESIKVDHNGYIDMGLKGNKIEFDNYINRLLGIENGIHFGKHIKSTYPPQLMNRHEKVNIYSSIAHPLMTGKNQKHLLKSIWIEKKYNPGDIIHAYINVPMYLPITSNSINNIEVSYKSDFNLLIDFPKNSQSSITLHFRNKNHE